jgi:hypothetical protein
MKFVRGSAHKVRFSLVAVMWVSVEAVDVNGNSNFDAELRRGGFNLLKVMKILGRMG